MSKKKRRVDIKDSKYFPEEYIEIFEKDYDELLKEEEAQLSSKVQTLRNSGISEESIRNMILSKYNSGVWFLFS